MYPHGRLGNVALRVRSLAVSVPFYTAVLGLREVARLDGPERDIVGVEMAFLSFGSNHHDLALLEAPQTRPADPLCAGLAHVALRIGDNIETLRAFRAHLRDQGVALTHGRDHEVSQSLYLRDPDGLLVEVYVDADPALWATRPEAVATVRPLRVDWLDCDARAGKDQLHTCSCAGRLKVWSGSGESSGYSCPWAGLRNGGTHEDSRTDRRHPVARVGRSSLPRRARR